MSGNKKIAEIFYEIADYLEMDGVPFKPRAYEKAAEVLESLAEDVNILYQKGGIKSLENIPGIGFSLAEKIEEFIKTKKIKYYEELKKKIPVDLKELRQVEGLGPKSIKKLYQKLNIKNLNDLKKAAEEGKIRKIEGFGEKSEEKILKSIQFIQKSAGKFLLYKILPEIENIKKELESLKEVQKVCIAGSLRRMKEVVGDADIVVVSTYPQKVIEYFVNLEGVIKIISQGDTKAAVKLSSGLNVDLRVVEEKSFGTALNYFTGSKEHNISLRELAIKKGLKLNEYGIFKVEKNKEKFIGGASEEEIYKILGMDYIEPEIRENIGEIELALKHKLPPLLKYSDLKGDLQIQTNWSDGIHSIEEMANAAIKAGLQYIAITDHTKNLSVAHGLNEEKLLKQMKEIDNINKKIKAEGLNFTILKGTECDILKDGSLDLPHNILEKLDIVGASIHTYFNLPYKIQTQRLIKAILNPDVDIIFHPTGRIIQKREPYAIDIEAIIKAAKQTKTVLEIDAYPDRLDLKDEYIKKCVEAGVKLSIDSDAHSVEHISYLKYGIAQARRGFAKKTDIINAWPLNKMKKFLK